MGRPSFGRSHMPHRAAVALLALGFAAGARAEPYQPPRLADGRPDLQGAWTNGSLTHLQRPQGLKTATLSEAEATAWENGPGGRPQADEIGQAASEWIAGEKLSRIDGQARTSWITFPPDGRLPYSPAGRKRLQAAQAAHDNNFDNPEARPASERCLTGVASVAGPPMLNAAYNANYQIVQTPDAVVIVAEMNHDARIVHIGSVAPLPGVIRQWTGESVGHWEGDTLVIETTGFHPLASFRAPTQLYLSPDARVTERLTRVSPGAIRYAFEVDDPQMFTAVWRADMLLRPAEGPLFEFACHEGNYALPGILAGARRTEAEARAARP